MRRERQLWPLVTAFPPFDGRAPRATPANLASMYAIETHNLRKEFGDDVIAVAGIDLAVEQGEMFGFLGPNGAGKTTTLRMLTTLLRPTSGEARVAGFDLYRQPHDIRRSIGVALQEAGLHGLSTGYELLELQAQLF